MSYILEALKKSQQEREVGLVSAGPADTPAERRGGAALGRHAWGYLSLALAAAAVMISLYGLVQGRFSERPGTAEPILSEASRVPEGVDHSPPAPELQQQAPAPGLAASRDRGPEASPDGAGSGAPTPADPEPASPQRLTPESQQAAAEPVASPRTDPESEGSALPGSARVRSGSVVEAVGETRLPAAPGVAPSPRTDVPRAPQPGATRSETSASQRVPEDAESVVLPGSVVDALVAPEAPERRLSELTAAVERRIRAAPPPAPAMDPVVDRVPDRPARKLPPGPSQLPPAVFRELPKARVLVHVYVDQPAQRFVILNSRKLREGDTSPEGLGLEEIVPEGVILGFKGHKFFIPR